ncbi:MAG: dTDP-4-dehydrorhamnose 3,5-epimerase family protein [Thermodesulfobacteriota bacterium]
MIKVSETKLKGVRSIAVDCFEDHRGVYVETYNEQEYRNAGIDVDFIQDDISVSSKHVLRGLHGDQSTWKLISCLLGKFYLVVLNMDKESDQYGQWDSFVLSDRDYTQVLVPPKFANGHLVLSEKAIFHYKQSSYYHPEDQFTIKWNDPEYKIWWPIDKPILSQRDQLGYFVK